MSEEALQQVLERLNADEQFGEKMKANWDEAVGDLDLSPAEIVALSTGDEDALRRLVGAEVTTYSTNFYGTRLVCTLACPITLDTPSSTRCSDNTCPGSKQGCGTHSTHNCYQVQA